MIKKQTDQLVLIDLMGLQSHANYVTSLYQAYQSNISKIYATKEAIDWNVVDKHCSNKKLYLNTINFNWVISSLKIFLQLISKKNYLLISGCTTYWHLVILILSTPKKVNIIIHNEFLKIAQMNSLGSKILKLIFKLYSFRGFKLAVMSAVMRDNVIKKKLYKTNLLYVITHPLPKTDSKIKFSKNGSVNLLGFLRSQKLHGANEFLLNAKVNQNAFIRIFGKCINSSDINFLKPLCDEFQVKKSDYSSEDEREFLCAHPCYSIVFFPNKKYDLLTSGSLIDAVRIGCYCIMPKPSKMAQELIGPLIIKDLVNRNEDPKLIINSMIKERKKLNYLQIDRMISS